MLIFSMGVSTDGYVYDRQGRFDWAEPDEEQFRFHLDEVRETAVQLCGRKLYETMLVWETDPAMRDGAAFTEFADAWSALPKVVFSKSLNAVEGNARLATASVADEVATALSIADAEGRDVGIGGAGLAAAAIEQGLIDEFRLFRGPAVVGGGTPFFPPDERIELDLIATRTFGERVVYERYRRRTR